MDHIGIDVHKRDSQICLLAAGGELIERRIRTEAERFAAVLGDRPRARIVIEASTDSEWVARCLEALGHEVIVADPNFAPMYATRTRKVKTDRRDARALADAGLLGAYRRAHRLSDPQRQVRGRLLVRDALVRTRTRYISVIRALLRQQGYRVPSGSAEAFSTRVRTLALPGPLLSLIAPLLALMRHLNRQLAYSDETIERVAAHDERVQRLRSVPSIGPVTAAAFVATIDDVQRFPHAHPLEADLGLVPRESSSGDTQRRGPITKAGSSRTRWLLIQAAVSMLLAWNEYLYQFLLLSSKSSMTVPVALAQFLSSDQSPWNYMMATAIVYALPPVAIYYAFRRRMTAGLTVGGVKG